MTLAYLDHVNIRTTRLAELTGFYRDVLGLEVGPRPNFPFNGAWLYCGERSVVHLIEVSEPPDAKTPSLDHFAFAGADRDLFMARLEAHDWPFETTWLPGSKMEQIRLKDPDGNKMHIDFSHD